MISTLALQGLRDVVHELGQLTVTSRTNGAGRSDLYRTLGFVSDDDGLLGLPSWVWEKR